jgi:hypothetical protein
MYHDHVHAREPVMHIGRLDMPLLVSDHERGIALGVGDRLRGRHRLKLTAKQGVEM